MHLASYRGPQVGANGQIKTAGGVSTGLGAIHQLDPSSRWYFMEGNSFRVTSADTALLDLPADLVQAHYAFCNRVLWPICHGLNQFVEFRESDYAAYRELQEKLAESIITSESTSADDTKGEVFAQDYQLGLLPALLAQGGVASKIFWHIPFNVEVSGQILEVAKEMVRGMLGAEVIGFHCQAYADNFIAFVNRHLSEYTADSNTLLIVKDGSEKPSQVVVSPLGTDKDSWTKMAAAGVSTPRKETIFLTVARGDYTKGIPELIEAWILFLAGLQGQERRKYKLLLRVDQTRDGVKAFDDEWERIISAYDAADAIFPGSVAVPEKLAPKDMAVLYAQADALLVPAHVDGLNLTAMEFVASQPEGSGAVVGMSSGAGLYDTFGEHVVELTPSDEEFMSYQLEVIAKRVGKRQAVEDMRALRSLVRTTGEWVEDFTSQVA